MKGFDPAQLPLPCFTLPVIMPQGDGSVVVRPGKPVLWMTPGQFAQAVGLSRDSIYRYIGTAALPDDQVQYCGRRKLRIASAAVQPFLDYHRDHR